MIDADTLQVPLVQAVYALIYLYGMVPSQAVQFAHVGHLEHGSVGLCPIPTEFSLESCLGSYLLGTLSDADLVACAHIDMAVAYLTDVVAVDLHLCVVHHILEVHIEQAVDAGICHFLAP